MTRPPIVGFMGTPGGVSFAAVGFDAALNAIGHNTGNSLFQLALWQRVKAPKHVIAPGSHCAGKVDVLVIPAANQVNPDWDLGGWADLVEHLNVPVVCLGLGAQAWHSDPSRIQLKEGTARLLRAISKRTACIGVRGEFTRQVLEAAGIENAGVVGCPAAFINPAVTAHGISRALEAARANAKPRSGYVFGTMEEPARAAEKALFAIGAAHRSRIIYQTELHKLRLLFDGSLSDEGRNFLAWEGGCLGWTPSDYLTAIQERGIFYSDARTWIDQMRRLDVVFGMRIHGALAAIQGGTLGVCVAFDSRTRELVETTGCPSVDAADVRAGETLASLLDKVKFDAAAFDERRAAMRSRMDCILAAHGL